MKELITELRIFIAETFLIWAFKITPYNDKDGKNAKIKIAEYFDSVLFKKQ